MKDFVKFVIFKDDNKKISKLTFLSSTWTESCMALGAKTCWGSGKNGSFSPGAAASIMALSKTHITSVKWLRQNNIDTKS